MTDLFSVSIRFNDVKPQMFKVRYINVTLKGLKDQLNEINLVWTSNVGRRENNVQSARIKERRREEHVSIFWQHNMIPFIDMFVTLQRSTEDILNSLIPPEDRD